mgnify:CR=1 FL=1
MRVKRIESALESNDLQTCHPVEQPWLLDQFSNVNYLWAIYLNVYLVDVVFAVHNPDSGARLYTFQSMELSAIEM